MRIDPWNQVLYSMSAELKYLVSGVVFGLAGGCAPGPTSIVVVTQTLRHGLLDGVKVAIAPLLTDAPIIISAVLLVGQFADMDGLFGALALAGALYLGYLARETWSVSPVSIDAGEATPHSIRRGVLANALNPHPYMFWFVVGAPVLLEAWDVGALPAVLFMVGQYTCLIGAKVTVAVLVSRYAGFFDSQGYLWINRLLALALLVYAGVFARDGMTLLWRF